jgi:cation diffusion facilitator family transporter
MAAGSKNVIYAALVGNALIASTKFVAASITGSSAMLSEGIHSLVDTGNQILLLHGIKQSHKPADQNFPFGHGKEIYFWSFVVAISIFGIGAGVSIYEGIHRLQSPHAIESVRINYLVLGLAMLFEGGAWLMAFRAFRTAKGTRSTIAAVRHGKDPTLFVVLFEDSAAMLGLMVAFLGVLLGDITHNPMWDGLAAICIGLILAATAAWLAAETKGLLIGESARPEVVAGAQRIARGVPHVHHVNEVLTLHMGPEYILVALTAEFDDGARADDIEVAVASFTKQLKSEFPLVKRVFVEAESRDAVER